MRVTICFPLLLAFVLAYTVAFAQGKPHPPKKATPAKSSQGAKVPSPVKNKTYDDSLTLALMDAIDNKDVEHVRQLLKNGANPNGHTTRGYIVLMQAITRTNLDIVKLLVEAGADISKLEKPDFESSGDFPLMEATHLNCLSLVEYLVSKGAPIDQTDSFGSTSLIAISCDGYVEMAEYLLKKGAKVNWQSDAGTTALMNAANFGKQEMVKLLLRYHANVNLKDNRGHTALSLAILCNYPEIAEALRAAGAKE